MEAWCFPPPPPLTFSKRKSFHPLPRTGLSSSSSGHSSPKRCFFPAPGTVLDGSQIILLLSLDLTHFYFNVWPAVLQGKIFFWSEFSLSYWGALKVSFFFIPARFPLTGHMKQGVRLGLTFSIFPLIRWCSLTPCNTCFGVGSVLWQGRKGVEIKRNPSGSSREEEPGVQWPGDMGQENGVG